MTYVSFTIYIFLPQKKHDMGTPSSLKRTSPVTPAGFRFSLHRGRRPVSWPFWMKFRWREMCPLWMMIWIVMSTWECTNSTGGVVGPVFTDRLVKHICTYV